MPKGRQIQLGIIAVERGWIRESDLLHSLANWLPDCKDSLFHSLEQAAAAEVRPLLERLFADSDESPGDGEQERLKSAVLDRLMRDVEQPGSTEEAGTENTASYDPDATPAYDFTQREAESPSAKRNDRFRILDDCAKGGLGVVYLARDRELDRDVALKKMLPSTSGSHALRDKFKGEAEITGKLAHPGIVPIYALGDAEDGPYYAMKMIAGRDLKKEILAYHDESQESRNSYQSVEFRRLMRRFVDICNAVEYAHSRGVLHLDLKPQNIMVGSHGETLVVDWGLARAVGKSLTTRSDPSKLPPVELRLSGSHEQSITGQFVGTPEYAPPEQLEGQTDKLEPRSEVYSLGAILFEILTCKKRIDLTDRDMGKIKRLANDLESASPKRISTLVPTGLDAICRKALNPDMTERYETAEALAEDVDRWLADEKIVAFGKREPVSELTRRVTRKYQSWVRSVGLAACLIIVALSLSNYWVNQARLREQRAKETAISTFFTAKKAVDYAALQLNEIHGSGPALVPMITLYAELGKRKKTTGSELIPELEVLRAQSIVRQADLVHLMQQKKSADSLNHFDESHQLYDRARSLVKQVEMDSGGSVALANERWSDPKIETARINAREAYAYLEERSAVVAEKAEELLDKALLIYEAELTKTPPDPYLLANYSAALSYKAELLTRAESDEARTTWEQSLEVFDRYRRTVGDENVEYRFAIPASNAALGLADSLYDAGEPLETHSHLFTPINSLELLSKLHPSDMAIHASFSGAASGLADRSRRLGDRSPASSLLSKLAFTQEILCEWWPDNPKYYHELLNTRINQSLVALDTNRPKQALDLSEIAISSLAVAEQAAVNTQNGLVVARATALNTRAQANARDESTVESAIEDQQSAIKLAREAGNDLLEAIFEGQLARLLHSTGDAEGSFEHFDASRGKFSEIAGLRPQEVNLPLTAVVWHFGEFHIEQGDTETSQQYFDVAIESYKKLWADQPLPETNCLLAKSLLRCREYSFRDASEALKFSQACYAKIPGNREYASVHAEALVSNEKLDEAQVILAAIKNEHGGLNAFDLLVLSEIARDRGKIDEAESHLSEARTWKAENQPFNLDLQWRIEEVEQSLVEKRK